MDSYYASLTPEQKAERVRKNRERKTPERREQYYQTALEKQRKRTALVKLMKAERGCYDCGAMLPPECLDWDHRPGTEKCFTPSKALGTVPIDQLVDELNKCDVVCANCHRRRTEQRRYAASKN